MRPIMAKSDKCFCGLWQAFGERSPATAPPVRLDSVSSERTIGWSRRTDVVRRIRLWAPYRSLRYLSTR